MQGKFEINWDYYASKRSKLIHCKTVNLVNTLGWLRGGCPAWTEEVMWCVTCWHYESSALQKSCTFGKIVKRYSIDSTPQIELGCTKPTCRGHGVRSRAGVRCKGHEEGSRAGGIQVARGDLHLQIVGVITVQTFWVKCRCQLVIRLKANKCYQGLLCSLSSFINLLVSDLCLDLWPLYRYYWQCNRYHPWVCPDHIASHIALAWSIVCIISPQSPSGPRRNSSPWWITHLHLDVPKVMPTASGWPPPSPLTLALLVAFLCRTWDYSFRSTTTKSGKALICK